jgi:DNA-binding response OmpR family regulator
LTKPQARPDHSRIETPVLGGASTAPRVLIVEDNLRYALELMRALRALTPQVPVRFDVDVTPDVDEALQRLKNDAVDIFIIDLKLENKDRSGSEDPEVGKELLKKIVENSNAGAIIHSSSPAETEAPELFSLGADDYIEKPIDSDIIRGKVLALWRRIQLTRSNVSSSYAHAHRAFKIGNWRFVVSDRLLRGEGDQTVRVSPTEHAFLRHMCVVPDHEIDRETFNVTILGRKSFEKDKRIDNFVYRLRAKLGPSLDLISKGEGAYKLIGVIELKAAAPSLKQLPR